MYSRKAIIFREADKDPKIMISIEDHQYKIYWPQPCNCLANHDFEWCMCTTEWAILVIPPEIYLLEDIFHLFKHVNK